MLWKAVLALGLVLSICAVTFPLDAEAQQVGRVYRIGVLGASTAAEHAEDLGVFRQALRELGWVNERAIAFEESYADGRYERLPRLAAELVALKVDLIFTGGTPATEAAMKTTREIPIVFWSIGDPVRQKVVQSLAHPGGNVTGSSIMSAEMSVKRLALLQEALPGIKRVAWLINGANPATAYYLQWAASQPLGIQVQTFDIRESENVQKTFEKMSRADMQALIIFDDGALATDANLKRFGGLALKHRLPMMTSDDEPGAAADHAVLIAYSEDTPALLRRAAAYVDKILKGSNPGDLPIEQPTKFRLIINLKTAKALGLTIPQSLLVRADEVIQ